MSIQKTLKAVKAADTSIEKQAIVEKEMARLDTLSQKDRLKEVNELMGVIDTTTEEVQWLTRLKAMKAYYGWTDEDIAKLAEYKDANSFRNSIRKTFPGLLKLAVSIFEKEHQIV